MNNDLKCDFIDTLRNVKKSDKAYAKAFIDDVKDILALRKQEKAPKTPPISEESLQWGLKLLKRKMNMDTSHMSEYQRLLHKANGEGLTYDEKSRFKAVQREQQIPDEPRCRCYSKGEDCKLHMIWGMNMNDLGRR